MAVIQVESVAITKSRLAKGFNGDNFNLNGKVITAEEADAGFKAAGSVKPPYVAVMVSGNQKGFAAGAAAAFNDYVKDVNLNKHNAESVINRFFDDMDSVVEKCAIDGARLSIGVVCAYDDCVVAAKSGNCHLLRFSEGELFEIALSDDDGGRGFQFVDMIADGDMFALIGEECSQDLDYDGIVSIFDSGIDLKLMIRDMFKLLAAGARGKDCSIALMRLGCDAEYTYAAVPVTEPMSDAAFDDAIAENPEEFNVQEDYEADNDVDEYAYNEAEEPAKASAKKKILGFIPVAILVIILAVAAALYLATRPDDSGKEGESIPDIIVNAEEDSTGDFNGSHGMVSVEDTEFGGDAGEVDEPEDEPETTTKKPSEPVRDPEPEEPEEPDEPAPETTTKAPETTTENTETTTVNGDTTTQAPADEPADDPEQPEAEPDAPEAEPVADPEA